MIKQIGIGFVLFTNLLSVMSDGNYMQHQQPSNVLKKQKISYEPPISLKCMSLMHVLTKRAVGND